MIALPPIIRVSRPTPIPERRRPLARTLQHVRWNLSGRSPLAFALALTATLGGTGPGLPWVLACLTLLAALQLRLRAERQGRLLAEREARTDALTGVPNRRGLDEALAGQLDSDGDFSVLLIDLDHFKRINDACGHLEGDRVLQEVAQLLRRSLRPDDVMGRWGGEEFLVLLPGVNSGVALLVAERLRRQLSSQVSACDGAVTASIGVAGTSVQAGARDLLARADAALYAAKRAGRNRTVLGGDFNPALGRDLN